MNPRYKNKFVDSAVNGIYNGLVLMSILILFLWDFIIAIKYGAWSLITLTYEFAFVVILFHTIVVRVTREKIIENIENQVKALPKIH